MVGPAVALSLGALVALAAPVDAMWLDSWTSAPQVDAQQRPDGVDADAAWLVADLLFVEAGAEATQTKDTKQAAATATIEPEDTPDKDTLARRDAPETPRAGNALTQTTSERCTCATVEASNDHEETRVRASTADENTAVYSDQEADTVTVESDSTPAPITVGAPDPVDAAAPLQPTETSAPAPTDEPEARPSPAPAAPATYRPTAAVTPNVAPPAAAEVVAAVAVAAAAGASGGWFLGAPGIRHLRHLLRKGWILALYAKVTKDRLLDHQTRQDILSQIENNPGIHLNQLRHALNLGHGTAAHHLRALEANGLVTSVRSGRRRCYFVPGASGRRLAAALGSPSARRVFSLIQERPGILQREIAQELGVTPTAVIFQVRRLQETGAVQKARVGREVAYYAGPV